MAKKKRKAAQPGAAGKVPPGYKKCPACGKVIKGPRTRICPDSECGHEFAVGGGRKAPEAAAEGADAVIAKMEAARALAELVGGPDRAEQIFSEIAKLGGIDNARKLVEYVAEEGHKG